MKAEKISIMAIVMRLPTAVVIKNKACSTDFIEGGAVEIERVEINSWKIYITLTVSELQACDREQYLTNGDDGVLGQKPHDMDLVVLHHHVRMKVL